MAIILRCEGGGKIDHGTLVQAAEQYAEYGWKLIPVKDKRPVTDDWPNQATSDVRVLDAWLSTNTSCNGIGVRLGKASGVVDVECDSDDGERLLDRTLSESERTTWSYTSSRGVHRLYKWDNSLPEGKAEISGVEYRLGGESVGFQSVLPPSRHPSGCEYRWLDGLSPDEVDLAPFPESLQPYVEQMRDKAAKRERIENAKSDENGRLIIAKGSRHDWVVLEAAHLAQRGYGTEDIMNAIRGILDNPDQVEAYDEHEVFKAAQSAVDNFRGISGDKVVYAQSSEIAKNGYQIDTFSAAELALMEFHDDPLIEGFLMRGQPGGIFGPQKSCKTTLAADLCLSLARGGQFLGTFNVPDAVRVCLLSAESGGATIQETFKRIAKTSVWPNLPDYQNLRLGFNVPTLDNPGHMAAVEDIIIDWELEVLILDPFYLMASGIGDSASNLLKMAEALWPLSELCQKTGVTLLVCHHFKKGREQRYGIPELEDITQTGFQEWLRQWILLGRREAYDEDNAPGGHKLWMRYGGSAGFGGLRGVDISEGLRTDEGGRHWKVDVLTASEVKASKASLSEQRKQEKKAKVHEETRARIRKAARRIGKDTKTQIRLASGLSPQAFEPVFLEMLDNGEFLESEIVKNGKSHGAYLLAD